MTVILTKHAQKRVRKRLGLNKKACERIAQKAFEDGIIHNDINGTLNKYLIHKENIHKNEYNDRIAKIYGEHIYIFDGNTLITAFGVPNEIKPMLRSKKKSADI